MKVGCCGWQEATAPYQGFFHVRIGTVDTSWDSWSVNCSLRMSKSEHDTATAVIAMVINIAVYKSLFWLAFNTRKPVSNCVNSPCPQINCWTNILVRSRRIPVFWMANELRSFTFLLITFFTIYWAGLITPFFGSSSKSASSVKKTPAYAPKLF